MVLLNAWYKSAILDGNRRPVPQRGPVVAGNLEGSRNLVDKLVLVGRRGDANTVVAEDGQDYELGEMHQSYEKAHPNVRQWLMANLPHLEN